MKNTAHLEGENGWDFYSPPPLVCRSHHPVGTPWRPRKAGVGHVLGTTRQHHATTHRLQVRLRVLCML